MSKHIDAKGQNCPIPVVMAKKEIDAGVTEFTVEVDNTIAVENLQRLADSQNYRTTVTTQNGVSKVEFTRTAAEIGEADAFAISIKPLTGRWSVFVGNEMIGGGDEELGRSLMKMFFFTLAQSNDLPASILFMNAGVKLPALEEQVIEHLHTLANKGVELLVCGTCLNFYGITDRLRVGAVSNMYDITERMKQADKVVTL